MSTLLIIDDEEGVRFSFRHVFEEDDVKVLTAATAAEGLEMVREHGPDVIILDLQLPDRSGLDLFGELKAINGKSPVIFITAHGTTDAAIEAMKQGAFDYLVKPVELDRLSQLIARAFEAARLMRVPALLPTEESPDRIRGQQPDHAGNVQGDWPNRPAGCQRPDPGRERHRQGTGGAGNLPSQQADRSPISGHQLRRHSRGTSGKRIVRPRTGRLYRRDSSPHRQVRTMRRRHPVPRRNRRHGSALQAKMLRVLQEQRFERLGSNETVQTRVRVLAATNHDLEKQVADGHFRKDLYYRLKGVTIRVPALREHLDDVPELAHHFLFQFNRELGKDFRALAPQTLERFQAYAWPGNVRELLSVIREAMLHASGHILLPEFLAEELHRAELVEKTIQPELRGADLERFVDSLLESGQADLFARAVEALERVLLVRVLSLTQSHQTRASELLGISRNTLRQKLKSLGFAHRQTA